MLMRMRMRMAMRMRMRMRMKMTMTCFSIFNLLTRLLLFLLKIPMLFLLIVQECNKL